jgi:hypothetical protein
LKHIRLENAGRRGWFVGSFPEAATQTDLAEVCYVVEPAGQPAPHYHTKCVETVLIVKGTVIIQGKEYKDGDIVIFEPGEVNDSYYVTETIMVGVKTPAGGNDKVYV